MNSSKSILPSPFKSAVIAIVIISYFVKSIAGDSDKHYVYSLKSKVPFILRSYFLNVRNNSISSKLSA
jgi:hypothetical protein